MIYNLTSALEIINKALKKVHYKNNPLELYEPIEYTLSNGGKRIRPVLTLLSAQLFSNDITCAIPAALAVEVFHNFTLLHDDLMDNASLRRNKQTVHEKWNANTAVLSGDAMLIMAYQQLQGCKREILPEVLTLFNKTAIEVCEGQMFDMNYESRTNVSQEEYMQMILLKTSVLLAASCKLGALCANANTDNANNLYEFGKNLGLAFQLQDDLLDVYADTAIFGKETGNDIVSNKKTLLLVLAMQQASGDIKEELNKWLAVKEFNRQEKITAVKNIYNDLEIKDQVKNKIISLSEQAIQSLNDLNIDDNKKTPLLDLAKELIMREK